MAFLKRLGYYLLGFSIGLIFLFYFLKEKRAEFCYAPNCRVLKNINSKKVGFSAETYEFINVHPIDSSQVRIILKEGDVLFSKSNPRDKPCALYYIEGMIEDKTVELSVKNCDSVATVETITYIK